MAMFTFGDIREDPSYLFKERRIQKIVELQMAIPQYLLFILRSRLRFDISQLRSVGM
jgi:hypothetical protein